MSKNRPRSAISSALVAAAGVAGLAGSAGCRVEYGAPSGTIATGDSTGPAGEVWVYTSMYQSVIDDVTPILRRTLPDVEVKWFQAGSEKVAQRYEAETAAGGSPACLLLTSDPFWYAHLAEEGRLAPHFAPNVLQLDRAYTDPQARWVTARLSLMVLAANETKLNGQPPPTAFADLARPEWRGKATTSDPMASGTAFTTFALWEHDNATFIDALHDNEVIAAGGNAAVLGRIESGERPIGVLLLENLLAAGRKNSPAKAIFPTDGAIAVPGPVALTSSCNNPVAAGAVYDALLSEEVQRAFVRGDLYAALPGIEAPAGAPALSDIALRPWPEGFTAKTAANQADFKRALAQRLTGD